MSWKVVGKHAVLGVAPGGVIEKEIPPKQAARLVRAGCIAEVAEGDSAAKEEAPALAAENPEEGD